ncbi:MAG: helix-turn-helix domain-containing protein [Gammaproteobacteria bacterium]|nr:helix-turn-helix domain-containing protein [Gammaproteobacteria bacterium]
MRSSLIDAEKRGLDLNDDGEGLEHRAALRRFAEARKLVSNIGTPESWPNEERSILIQLRDRHMSIRSIANALMRKPEEVAIRLLMVGRNLGGKWSEEEDRIIVDGFSEGSETCELARRLPGRTLAAVRGRGRILCVNRSKVKPWTKAEDHALLEMWSRGVRGDKIAEACPGRSGPACHQHLHRILQIPRNDRPWDNSEILVLIRGVYNQKSVREIAEWLGRNDREVRSKIRQLGLKKKNSHSHIPEIGGAAVSAILAAGNVTQFRGGRKRKIPEDKVTEVKKKMAERKTPVTAIAKEYGVSRSALYRTVNDYQVPA